MMITEAYANQGAEKKGIVIKEEREFIIRRGFQVSRQ